MRNTLFAQYRECQRTIRFSEQWMRSICRMDGSHLCRRCGGTSRKGVSVEGISGGMHIILLIYRYVFLSSYFRNL